MLKSGKLTFRRLLRWLLGVPKGFLGTLWGILAALWIWGPLIFAASAVLGLVIYCSIVIAGGSLQPEQILLVWLLVSFMLASCCLVMKWGRRALVFYAGLQYEVSHCQRLRDAINAHPDHFVAEFKKLKLQQPIKGKWARRFRALRTLFWLSGVLLFVESFPYRLTSLGPLPEPHRIELAAVLDTLVLVGFAHAHMEEEEMEKKALKGLGLPLMAIGIVGLFAIIMLLVPSSRKTDVSHVTALVAIGGLQFLYDRLAWNGSKRAGTGQEHLEMCWLVDLPNCIASAAVFLYWGLGKMFAKIPSMSEGFLAGAILMQFVVSVLLFVIVKEGLHKGGIAANREQQKRAA